MAGRVFRPVTSRSDGKVNFDQYNYLMSHVWAATQRPETMAELLSQVAASGLARRILAGLVEEEVDGEIQPWTTARAEAIAKFFEQPQTFEDCATMSLALVEGVSGFFPGALGSWSNSRGASPGSTPTTSEAPASATPTDSESSAPLSEFSPVTI